MAAILANHGRMFRAGATMVPGTDAGVSPGKPHDVLPYALRALVEQIGMTPRQALRAATTIAAGMRMKLAAGRTLALAVAIASLALTGCGSGGGPGPAGADGASLPAGSGPGPGNLPNHYADGMYQELQVTSP